MLRIRVIIRICVSKRTFDRVKNTKDFREKCPAKFDLRFWVDPRLFERVFLVHNFSSSSLYRGDERVKQILAVIALNQLETKVNNLQMCIIRCRFEQVLWRSPFTHANFCNFVLLRHLCLFSKFASKLVL